MNARLVIVAVGLVGGFALSVSAAAATAGDVSAAKTAPAGNPYATLASRNVFGLVPIPVHDPAQDVQGTPPPKITPNGIMTIFGRMQVLFKVQQPAAGGQPAKELSYTMSEGERQDEIEVQKIDEKAATITFNNHGTVQTLELVKAAPGAAGGAPAPGGGPGGGPAGGMPRPGGPPPQAGHPGGANITAVGGASRLAQARAARNAATQGASSGGTGAIGSGGSVGGSGQTANEPISPEAQIIMMEAQRAKFMDEGDSAAGIIPPTPITDQLINNEPSQ